MDKQKLDRISRRRSRALLSASLWLGGLASHSGSTLAASSGFIRETRVFAPCTAKEHWTFSPEFRRGVPLNVTVEFNGMLAGKHPPVRGFAESLALRGLSTTESARFFSQYWISRAFFSAGLYEIAVNGFDNLLSQPTTGEHRAVQLAALGCISQLNLKHRAFIWNDTARSQMLTLTPPPAGTAGASADNDILWTASTQAFMQGLESGASKDELLALMSRLRGGGVFLTYADGYLKLAEGNVPTAIARFKNVLAQNQLPALLAGQRQHLRVLIGRLEYQEKAYGRATEQFRHVDKHSNELVASLTGLAWSQLMAGRYPEAIGVSVGVQSSWLKNTFVPEPLLVSAISLNELCHYPESLRMIDLIRREYKSTFQWLKNYHLQPQSHAELYPLATAFLKKKEDQKNLGVPTRIVSEWIRSPLFLAYQDGLNTLIEHRAKSEELAAQGEEEELSQATALIDLTQHLRESYKKAKIMAKPGEPLPVALLDEFRRLKGDLVHFRRLSHAAPIWGTIFQHAQTRVDSLEKSWLKRIEKHLASITENLFENLNELGETTDLIEVEIMNGASKDIIRENVEANFQAKLAALKKKHEAQKDPHKKSASDVYEWGESISTLTGKGEIWEDELDSLTAKLTDRCVDEEQGTKSKSP